MRRLGFWFKWNDRRSVRRQFLQHWSEAVNGFLLWFPCAIASRFEREQGFTRLVNVCLDRVDLSCVTPPTHVRTSKAFQRGAVTPQLRGLRACLLERLVYIAEAFDHILPTPNITAARANIALCNSPVFFCIAFSPPFTLFTLVEQRSSSSEALVTKEDR